MIHVKVSRGVKGQPTREERTVRDLVINWLASKSGVEGNFALSISRSEAPTNGNGRPVTLISHLFEDGTVKLVVHALDAWYGCVLHLPGKEGNRNKVYRLLNGNGVSATVAQPVQTPVAQFMQAKKEPDASLSLPLEKPAQANGADTSLGKPSLNGKPDIVLDRRVQGNAETHVHVKDRGEKRVLAIRRGADDHVTFIRRLKDDSEQAVSRQDLSRHEHIGVILEDLLHILKCNGQYGFTVTERSFKFKTWKAPCLLVKAEPEGDMLLLVAESDYYRLCRMKVPVQDVVRDVYKLAASTIPVVEIEQPEAVSAQVAANRSLSGNDSGKKPGSTDVLSRLLAEAGLTRFRIEMTDKLLRPEAQKRDFAVDGPMLIHIPVRLLCEDGKCRRMWVIVEDYETACAIRYVLSR